MMRPPPRLSQHGCMPVERRRPEAPDAPESREARERPADLEPYLAELASLRPADDTSEGSPDQLDDPGEQPTVHREVPDGDEGGDR